MANRSNYSFHMMALLAVASVALPGMAAAQDPYAGMPPATSSGEVPFSLTQPTAPGVQPPQPVAPPTAPIAPEAAPAAPKDWTEMTAAELGTERTRLDGELNRADSHYTPVEKKKMRNLLRRIETELSKKSLEPAIMTTPAAAAGVEGAPVNGGAAVAPAAAGAAPAKAEKPREKTTSEKIRDKIHSRRFGTPKNASESSGDQPSPTYGKKNN